ncbi:MAG: large conductance mechanosensitive channel protein MscL [Actinomycetota bacterium]|nr:large conductance mechanosensitive channel protein MscL [Actinomycetota bacterium]MDH4016226.1 large conductance mechanosensitive channel protein MscL [Actinomycetota bacterium]
MSEEKTGVIQGFKEFVMRGNVIDLAVAVVIGAAFTAVVVAFNDYVITPVLAALGGADTSGFGFCIRAGDSPCTSESATFVDLGAVFAVLVSFLITMLVVYFIFVLPMNKARERTAEAPAEDETPEDVVLLTEIRDLLAEQRAGGGSGNSASGPDA